MRVWLKGGPMSGTEVLVSDGTMVATYPMHYNNGYKAVLVQYNRTGKYEMEFDASKSGQVLDIPKPVADRKTRSLVTIARIRMNRAARRAAKQDLRPFASARSETFNHGVDSTNVAKVDAGQVQSVSTAAQRVQAAIDSGMIKGAGWGTLSLR